MPVDLSQSLVVGISSRALFNLDKENDIFEKQGLTAYVKHQIAHAEEPLEPGNGFGLIKAILAINEKIADKKKRLAEVVIVSRNGPETSLRLFRSIEHHKLDIRRVSLSGGEPNAKYLKAFNVGLYLSANEDDVRDALAAKIPAALLYTRPTTPNQQVDQIRIAFDGDAVLFSGESEQVYQDQGIEAFNLNETRLARVPLRDGPFAPLLRALARLQKAGGPTPLLRIALITARGRVAAGRVIRTLARRRFPIDEAHFMDGVEKTRILEAFRPHIFFDDQKNHCDRAATTCVVARVPGVPLAPSPVAPPIELRTATMIAATRIAAGKGTSDVSGGDTK